MYWEICLNMKDKKVVRWVCMLQDECMHAWEQFAFEFELFVSIEEEGETEEEIKFMRVLSGYSCI
jgi:hypothetical protein